MLIESLKIHFKYIHKICTESKQENGKRIMCPSLCSKERELFKKI